MKTKPLSCWLLNCSFHSCDESWAQGPCFCWQSIICLEAIISALQTIWSHEAIRKGKNKQGKFCTALHACSKHHCMNNHFHSSSTFPRGNLQSVKDFPLTLLLMPLYWLLHQCSCSELLQMQQKVKSYSSAIFLWQRNLFQTGGFRH